MILKQIISRSGNLETLTENIDASLLAFDFDKICRDEIYNNHKGLQIFSDSYKSDTGLAVANYLCVQGSKSERTRSIAKCHLNLFNVSKEKAERVFRLLNSSDVYIE